MAKLTYNADFIFASAHKGNFPKHELPEICFVGRSNVGKSSLINSIVKRKNLARVSITPGKTQQINFYNVEDTWCLVDLPGFGYTSKGRTIGSDWKTNNFEYIKNRENLKLVCLLVDSRHDPMEIDLGLMEELEIMQRKYIVVLTKCDKINSTLIEARTKQWQELLINCNYNIELLPYSSVNGLGRNNIIAVIKKYCSKEFANTED